MWNEKIFHAKIPLYFSRISVNATSHLLKFSLNRKTAALPKKIPRTIFYSRLMWFITKSNIPRRIRSLRLIEMKNNTLDRGRWEKLTIERRGSERELRSATDEPPGHPRKWVVKHVLGGGKSPCFPQIFWSRYFCSEVRCVYLSSDCTFFFFFVIIQDYQNRNRSRSRWFGSFIEGG